MLGGNYDYRCDIWSLGVIAYMLLSGAPPFNGDSSEKIHHLILVNIRHFTLLYCALLYYTVLHSPPLHCIILWTEMMWQDMHAWAYLTFLYSTPLFLMLLFPCLSIPFALLFSSLFSSLHFFLFSSFFLFFSSLQHKEPDYSSKMFPKALDTTIDFLKLVSTICSILLYSVLLC